MADNDKPDRATVKAGQRQKFDWCRAVSADELSSAAKHLACITAIDKFGSNGSFRATQRELAKICGASGRTVRRAIKELTDENYWAAENLAGANRYTIIPQNERQQMWAAAERDWQKQADKWEAAKNDWEWRVKRWLEVEQKTWLDAEKQFVRQWLDAEKQFVRQWLDAERFAWLTAERDAKIAFEEPVYNAMCGRGMDGNTALRVARNMWEGHQEGRLPLDVALQVIAHAPQEHFTPATEVATEVTDMATQAADMATEVTDTAPQVTDMAATVATADPLTSGDDDFHKSFQVRQDRQGLDKNFQDAPATPRALTARATQDAETATLDTHIEAYAAAWVDRSNAARRAAAGQCQLCSSAGWLLDADGRLVEMLNDVDDETCLLECQHSTQANVAEIHRIESESEGYWRLAATGLVGIDSQFPHLAGDYDCDDDIHAAVVDVEMDGARNIADRSLW